MESRLQRILLEPLINSILQAAKAIALITIVFSTCAQAQASNKAALVQDFASSSASGADVDIETRTVLEDVLDNEIFEIGAQFGVMSIEDFESNAWVSANLSFHITEYFYAKVLYGQSEAGQTSFEKLVNVPPLLTEEQRELSYYGLNIGYNLMPGETFIGRDFVLNNVLSIELGAGLTKFAGDDKFTVNVTANYRVFLTDWMAWDIAMSDYIFDTNLTGENKTTHNLNFTTGFAFYF